MSIYINSYTLFSSFILYIFVSVLDKLFFLMWISKCSFHSMFAETATSEDRVRLSAEFGRRGAKRPFDLMHSEP